MLIRVVSFCVLALTVVASMPAFAQQTEREQQVAQRKRPRVTIYPRRYDEPGPYSKRHCVSWLAKEYRVSGTVITPQMRCWWD